MNFICVLNFVLIIINSSVYAAVTEHVGQARIIGGHDAKPHSHPYIVSLQTRFLWVRIHVCGGSILSEEWVLTAAHCVSESWLINWLSLDAIAGAHDVNKFGPNAQIVPIDQRIPHPSYAGGIAPFDIAVLRTRTKFIFSKYIQPINLPTSNFRIDDKVLMLSGWGALKTTILIPDLPERLQELQVKYISYQDCYIAIETIKEDFEINPLDKKSHICTGPLGGGMAACTGDSGGPLVQAVPRYKLIPYDDIEDEEELSEDVFDDDNDKSNIYNSGIDANSNIDNDTVAYITEKVPVVLGVVSFGFSPCGYRGSPTVYTKVSQYIDFIQKYVK